MHEAHPDLPDTADAAERRRRVVVAGHRGEVDVAREALADGDPEIRAAALGALARCGDLDDGELLAGLADEAVPVRRRAALVAARHPGGDLVTSTLVVLLEDPADMVAEVAAFALGERDPGKDRAAVVRSLSRTATGHHDALCREAATAALGAIGDPRGLDAVLSACADRATVRRRAVLALAAFDDPRATAMLRRLCADRDLQVRQAAADLLAIEEGEEI